MVTKKSFYSKIYKNKFMGYPNGVIADGLVFLSGIFGNDQNEFNKNFDKIPLQGRDKKQGYFVADEREATVALDSWSVHNQINELLQFYAKINASSVFHNDHTAFRVDWMPFAGLKNSGHGTGGIKYSMHDMQIDKMLVLRK